MCIRDRIYYDMREVSDRLCKENGLSVIPPSQNKGMGYKEYTEAKMCIRDRNDREKGRAMI